MINSANNNPNIVSKIVLLLGANWCIMAGASLSPVVPSMMREFSDMPGMQFWISMVLTLPAVFVVIAGPVIGFLIDRFGRKPIYVFSLLLGGLGGSMAYFMYDLDAILITRALVGVSIAGSLTATNALIADYFDGQQRSKFMGLNAAAAGLAGVIFLPLGGFLADVNWRSAFLAYIPLVILFPIALFAIKEPVYHQTESDPITSHRLRISTVLAFIFSSIFISHFAFVTIPIYVADFMVTLLNTSGIVVGLIGAVASLFSFIGGILFEKIARKTPYQWMTMSNLFLFALGFMSLGFASAWFLVLFGYMTVAFCMGLNNATLTTWLAKEASVHTRGRANGLFVTLMSIGPFAASFVFAPIVTRMGYSAAFILSGILTLIMGLVGFSIKDHSKG